MTGGRTSSCVRSGERNRSCSSTVAAILSRRRARFGKVCATLGHGLEKFVALAQAAHAHVFVFEHGLDDSQDRTRAQIISAIKCLHGLEDLFLAEARIFERG